MLASSALKPFECLKDNHVPVVEHKGYVVTLLKSAAEIGEEGGVMGHCVGMYADSVRQGEYLVYSVTKDGERSSTIGIETKAWQAVDAAKGQPNHRVQQHYGRFNAHVTDVDEKEIGGMLVARLNETQEEMV